MSLENSWAKVFRIFMDWEWYKNSETKDVFLHLMLKANFRDGRFEGIPVKRGQLVTSRAKLADELGLSVQQVRTALKNLKSTGSITIEPTSKFSVITLVNYNYYQGAEQESNQPSTNVQPADNPQSTTVQPSCNPQPTGVQPQVKKLRNKEVNNSTIQEVKFNCTNREMKSPEIENSVSPTMDDLYKYCVDNELEVDLIKFYGHYSKYNWTYAGKPLDWKKQLQKWNATERQPRGKREPETFNEMKPSYDLADYEDFSIFD